MKYLITIFSSLLICCSLSCKSQPNLKPHVIDFVVINKQIWGLTTTGQLVAFTEDGEPLNIQPPQNKGIFIITKDKQNNLIVADSAKHIRLYNNKANTWTTTNTYKRRLYGIVYDSKNQQHLITDRGIKMNNVYYLPDTTYALNKQLRFSPGLIAAPSAYTIDKNDNIWMGYAAGEWGGDIYIFNTQLKKFVKPKAADISPVKSIFEIGQDVYISSGLQHFDTFGEILKFVNLSAKSIFTSNSYKKDKNGIRINKAGEYIGPATFNKFDGQIYFYSQNGFFKGDPKSDLSDLKYWQHVFSPKLHWTNGQNNAVGSPMNVLKIEFISQSKFIYATANDGLCLYDGYNQIILQ
jgi:hypothetical protein